MKRFITPSHRRLVALILIEVFLCLDTLTSSPFAQPSDALRPKNLRERGGVPVFEAAEDGGNQDELLQLSRYATSHRSKLERFSKHPVPGTEALLAVTSGNLKELEARLRRLKQISGTETFRKELPEASKLEARVNNALERIRGIRQEAQSPTPISPLRPKKERSAPPPHPLHQHPPVIRESLLDLKSRMETLRPFLVEKSYQGLRKDVQRVMRDFLKPRDETDDSQFKAIIQLSNVTWINHIDPLSKKFRHYFRKDPSVLGIQKRWKRGDLTEAEASKEIQVLMQEKLLPLVLAEFRQLYEHEKAIDAIGSTLLAYQEVLIRLAKSSSIQIPSRLEQGEEIEEVLEHHAQEMLEKAREQFRTGLGSAKEQLNLPEEVVLRMLQEVVPFSNTLIVLIQIASRYLYLVDRLARRSPLSLEDPPLGALLRYFVDKGYLVASNLPQGTPSADDGGKKADPEAKRVLFRLSAEKRGLRLLASFL